MSASHASALDAIALQLVAALDQYDVDVAALVGSWRDLERYRNVSTRLDEIRMYSSALPDVRVQWVELLIAHAELVHCLWRMQHGEGQVAQVKAAQVREHHAGAILALRNRSVRVIGRGELRRL